ncbi:hypothetical protein ZIOFF_009814 [Zingiber officinale]|uniref:Pentatricopeptide repeat-containing protein n=1 Tax=Zingiber officinale TaxID=94328 RepID=A0A8J5LRP9_ZINOF|nr:hypothetical protein ZIOFF_009814 [Zingiber officinale]
MAVRNLVSWNALIVGLIHIKLYCDAMEAFCSLLNDDGRAVHGLAVKLESSLAYVRNSLIDMYCKCGCLEEAAKGHSAAVHSLIVKTTCAQNQCDGSSLITMYAKCVGHLDEAMQSIDAMSIQPDSFVWGVLLAACRKFRNLELDNKVEQKLFRIKPHNSGNYVLFSKMYASHGMLEEAKEIRRLMQFNGGD